MKYSWPFVYINNKLSDSAISWLIFRGHYNLKKKNLIATINAKPEIRFAVEDGNLTALLAHVLATLAAIIMKNYIEASAEEIVGLKKIMAIK